MYQELIKSSYFQSRTACSFLKKRASSILKPTFISFPDLPDHTTTIFYARDLPLALPPPNLYKSRKDDKKKKKKKHRAFGDVIPPKISYPLKESDWRFLPTRAFANVMNFLDSPDRENCYTVCRQWTIKFKKTYDTSYKISNMLDALDKVAELTDLKKRGHFIDMSYPDFPEQSKSYLDNKEARFSKQCYEKKGPSPEYFNKLYENVEQDMWFGMQNCTFGDCYDVDHEEREQQLALYVKSYDTSEI